MNVVQASKFLALILRHKPETIGITLDPEGWADIAEILRKAPNLTRDLIDRAVAENGKARYAVSDDGLRIRARQGHSVKDVDLGFKPVEPPEFLYHGSNLRALAAIWREGLKKMDRQHVHMACEVNTASSVGMRRGSPVLLKIRSGVMHRDGFEFYQSENGVWLTDHVPPIYLEQVITDQDRSFGNFIYMGLYPDSSGPRVYGCRFCGEISPPLEWEDMDRFIAAHVCPRNVPTDRA